MSYKVVDLFSGSGGLSSGFRSAGFEISAGVEAVKIFCRTHQYNFPESQSINARTQDLPPAVFGQIVGLTKGSVDVIIGGPPCQTFSSIGTPKIKSLGKTEARTDPRTYLFEDFFQYVDYFKPSVFLMENVPAMRTKYGGE